MRNKLSVLLGYSIIPSRDRAGWEAICLFIISEPEKPPPKPQHEILKSYFFPLKKSLKEILRVNMFLISAQLVFLIIAGKGIMGLEV